MSTTTTLTLTNTLADNARQQLEPWLKEAATLARSRCLEQNFSGVLMLVATDTDTVWAQYPGNVTNMADVIANVHPPNILARITWNYPAGSDPDAVAAKAMLYKQATDRHMAYSVATTRLSTVNSFSGQRWRIQQNLPQKGFCWNRPVRSPPAPSD
jgi:hypothetical protein